MKKNLYQKIRDAVLDIDETLPEIRGGWNLVRDALWAYVKFTLAGAVLIIGAGAWLGVYALLNNAHADTIFSDVEDCSQHRRCGYMKPVYRAKPLSAGGGYEFSGTFEGATAQGHNPRISCPPGLIRWPAAAAEADSEYTCINMSAPPLRVDIEPALRPCYGEGGQPCNGVADYWNGEWYGTWRPGYTPPQCPLPLVPRAERSGESYGRVRYYCGSPF